MPLKWSAAALVLAAALAPPARPPAQAGQQDYLTQTEAEAIRDAYTSDARIGLFLDFATDRLRRFHHELDLKDAGPKQADFLNSLLDAFTSCVDEASGRIDDAISNGEDVRKGLKDFQKRVSDFLSDLQKLQSNPARVQAFHLALSDAVSDLKDDLQDAAKAKKRLELNLSGPKRHGGSRR